LPDNYETIFNFVWGVINFSQCLAVVGLKTKYNIIG